MNQVATIRPQTSGFSLAPRNVEEAMKLAEMICNSDLAPKNFKGKPADTLVAMMMGTELGLNPLQAIQNIAVINGRPSIWGDAMLALVQNHPSFGGIEETFDRQTMTATCTVWRKNGPRHTQTFSKENAEKAGLWGKQGPWQQYPERMIPLRARGFALRNQFADALAGLISREEAMDLPVEGEFSEQPTIEYYKQSDFDKNSEAWRGLIQSGKRTPSQIIAMVSSKATLTETQKKAIEDMAEGEKQ